jgi:hypothetical protein
MRENEGGESPRRGVGGKRGETEATLGKTLHMGAIALLDLYMGKMREKGARAGYVPGPLCTDSGRYRTVLDVIGRYLDHRFSWFEGISWRGRRALQGPEKDVRDQKDQRDENGRWKRED